MSEENKVKDVGGRPPLYKTPEELQKAVDEYFLNPPNKRKVYKGGSTTEYTEIPFYAVSGMALALGFESRQSLYDYDKRDDRFSYIIKRARLFIESEYEVALRDNNVTGIIFALKQMGWKDKQELKLYGNLNVMDKITVDDKPLDTGESKE